MKRSGPLKRESRRRQSERDTRRTVREAALHRAGHRCSAAQIVPEIACGGPLDVDEIRSRGVNPGGHLDDSNVQVLCRLHHQWRTEHPAEARARGLRLESWESPLPKPVRLPTPSKGAPIPVVHDARGGTVDWMCAAIQLPDGRRYYAAASMLTDGIAIPDDVLAKACGILDPDDAPFPPEACFCVVDAATIVEGLCWQAHIDELGDHMVTGPL